MNLLVKEIFYSIQGEGGRAGAPSIFIRLARCNRDCSFCDTDWKEGTEMTLQQIYDVILPYQSHWIVWTGGEPTLQLTDEVIDYFSEYMHAIETNGTNPVPNNLDYISVSPKEGVTVEMLRENFPERDQFRYKVDEFRYAFGDGELLPPKWDKLPSASHYYVSPIFTGKNRNLYDEANVAMAASFVMENPRWNLSIQIHKIIKMR